MISSLETTFDGTNKYEATFRLNKVSEEMITNTIKAYTGNDAVAVFYEKYPDAVLIDMRLIALEQSAYYRSN